MLLVRTAVLVFLGALPLPASARIEEARFVPLGGIEQWITIRGSDARNPILLLIHGGPGDVQSSLVSAYRPYEKDFVLVQWDQRGAGKTYARYGDSTPELTLDRVAKDGIELARYLERRFPNRRIVLLGHSWGTAIATRMVLSKPGLFAAYVGTGQIASWAESVNAQFDFLKEKAREEGNAAMRAELDSIGRPDPMNKSQYFKFTRPLGRYLDPSDAAWLAGLVDLLKRQPGYAAADLTAMGQGMDLSGRTFLPTQMREALSTEALDFRVPYFVIQGRDDRFTPTAPAAAYFAKVRAPAKKMIVIEGAGHFALVTHSGQFVAALKALLGNGSTPSRPAVPPPAGGPGTPR